MGVVVEKNNKYCIGILKEKLFWDMKKVQDTFYETKGIVK